MKRNLNDYEFDFDVDELSDLINKVVKQTKGNSNDKKPK